ncbi:MAG: insulinase family protein, partial [Sphingomonadaceae bacterium]|nr:insulinase family protein [Sphingomonadaceae bacterium]
MRTVMRKFSHALALAALLLSTTAYAQATQAAPAATKAVTQPWLYEGSDVPVDDTWTFGVLPNGLRYAVKKNDVPAGQVSIRVRIDAGALHENNDEQGFAHLIEHLSFRGSTFVPDGEAKRIWQRFGVTFGSDSN